jgi:hypothetical protein
MCGVQVGRRDRKELIALTISNLTFFFAMKVKETWPEVEEDGRAIVICSVFS